MSKRRHSIALCCSAALIVALQFNYAPGARASVRTIALSGQNPFADGVPVAFNQFSTPSLNNRGKVAFSALLTGTGITSANDTSYWVADAGTFRSVGREGEQAPGMPAGTEFLGLPFFTAQPQPAPINEAGEVAFVRSVQLPNSSTSTGIWATQGDALQLRASQGQLAAGAVDNATFVSFNTRPTLNRAGLVAFSASLTGATYSSNLFNAADGVWLSDSTGIDDVALVGQIASEAGADAAYTRFLLAAPTVNRNGEIAFFAEHALNNGSGPKASAVWRGTAAGRSALGIDGQLLPELGGSATAEFLSAVNPAINRGGALAIQGGFDGASGSPTSGNMIATLSASGPNLIAYLGDTAPGAGLGHEFDALFYEPSLGSGGHVAFYGSEWDGVQTSTRLSGVWTGLPDALYLVARQGDPAPGANANFGSFIRDTPGINQFGQIAFRHFLTNVQPGPVASSVWATTLDGDLALIARQGHTIEIVPGDERTIANASLLTNHGDDDGRPRAINDLGQIAFYASFTDGTSGIFLSNAVAHLPGDYNRNNTVDAADYTVWRNSVASQDPTADGTRDGMVDRADYELWKEFYGISLDLAGNNAAYTVPEPGAVGLVLLLLLVVTAVNARLRSRIRATILPAA